MVSVKGRLWAVDQGKMQTETDMQTADHRHQKCIFCVIVIVTGTNLITNLTDMQARIQTLLSIWHFSSFNQAFVRWCYTYRDAPLVFNIWQTLCILFIEHGCLLFFKFTLASGVLLMQEFSRSIKARFLQVGKTFAKKLSRIFM